MAILIAGWSAAWFFIESKVVEVADTAKARLAERGQTFDCRDQAIAGYPFRITFDCSTLNYKNSNSGLEIETGAMRSVSQAYQPGKVVVELDAPAAVETLGNGRFKVDWASLRGSMKLGLSGRERTSLVGKDVLITPFQDPSQISMSGLEYHDRLSGENDVDVAVALTDLKEKSAATLDLIDFDLRTEATFKDIHDRFSRGRNLMDIIRQTGVKGNLQRFQISAKNGAQIRLSGPFDASQAGLMNAKLKVEVTNLDALIRLLIFFNPAHEKAITEGSKAVKLFAPADESGTRSVNLTIQDNVLKLGFIPIGRIPFWL